MIYYKFYKVISETKLAKCFLERKGPTAAKQPSNPNTACVERPCAQQRPRRGRHKLAQRVDANDLGAGGEQAGSASRRVHARTSAAQRGAGGSPASMATSQPSALARAAQPAGPRVACPN